MNPLDLTVNELERATVIKGQIEALNKELRVLGAPATTPSGATEKANHERCVEKKLPLLKGQDGRTAVVAIRRRNQSNAPGRPRKKQ